MKKVAIFIDSWKVKIFKKTLDSEGYAYSEIEGPTKNCIILTIETNSIAKLQPIVERMNAEAVKSRMH